jgi:hypothetical protein
MLQPQRKIIFTKRNGTQIIYDYVAEISIKLDRESLTNTAKITIPRKLVYNSGTQITPQNFPSLPVSGFVPVPTQEQPINVNYVVGDAPLFERGDQVEIQIGYYPNLFTRYSGYISRITTTLPIEIFCEDGMWLLKQNNVTFPDSKTFKKNKRTKAVTEEQAFVTVTLKQLLDYMFQYFPNNIKYKTVDDNLDLGKFRVSHQSPAKILEILKDRYGLYSKFQPDGTLYVGFGNDATTTNTQVFVMEEVIINNDTLDYQNSEDVKIRIHGVSMQADNTKLEYDFPEDAPVSGSNQTNGYDTITKFTYNQSMAGLKKFVQNLYPTIQYTGYRGKVKTFGEPPMRTGDICVLKSNKLPERNGSYLIKEVEIEDGNNGYFQTFDLGIKVG